MKKAKIVNLRNLKKRLKKTVKKNPPKSKKVVKKSSEDNNKEIKKTVVTGEEFKKLQRKAKRLGAKSLDFSNRKNNKYVVEYNDKKIHFGSIKYDDYLTHRDNERRDKYLARAKKIKNKQDELTWEKPESANFWSARLLWNKRV